MDIVDYELSNDYSVIRYKLNGKEMSWVARSGEDEHGHYIESSQVFWEVAQSIGIDPQKFNEEQAVKALVKKLGYAAAQQVVELDDMTNQVVEKMQNRKYEK